MIYLLDTNVWVAILRTKYPQVATRYGATNRADIRICSVVIAELRYGCAKSAKPAAKTYKQVPEDPTYWASGSMVEYIDAVQHPRENQW